MKNLKKTLFTIEAEEFYKRMADHANLRLHDLDMGKLEAGDLDEACQAILSEVYIWPQISLKLDSIVPQIQSVKPDEEILANLLEGGVDLKGSEQAKILEIKYPVPYEGSPNALDLSVDKEPKDVLIYFNSDMEILFYTAKEIDDVNEEIKAKKEDILKEIQENQVKLNTYFTGKEYELRQQIRESVDKLFKAAVEERANIQKLV